MNWTQINDWFDDFYKEYIEGKKQIRGRAFSGAHIEIFGRDSIVIVVHDPYLRGKDKEQRAWDFVRNAQNGETLSLHAEMNYARFEKIVSGEQPLKDEDWVWHDE
jgi:hypothetical protein